MPDARTARISMIALCAIIALSYAVWRWSVTADQLMISQASIFAALRLLIASLVITFIGFAGITAMRRWVTRDRTEHLRPPASLHTLILSAVLGQILAMVWLFVRSGLNGLLYLLARYQLPITVFEVAGLLLGCAFILGCGQEFNVRHTVRTYARPVLLYIFLLIIAVLPIAVRELPREIALSSDPDQHAFWAAQVIRIGSIPWDQGILGMGSFNYPAGFAAINAIWVTFSGLSAIEIVTIQPIIQFLLAVFLVNACAQQATSPRRRVPLSKNAEHAELTIVIGCLVGVLLYWTVLPYGLQKLGFFGEGTARLSASLLAVIPLVSLICFQRHLLSPAERFIRLAAIGASTALLATVNPVTAIFNVGVTALCFLREIVGFAKGSMVGTRSSVRGMYVLLLGGLCGLTVLCDPYYAEKVFPAFGSLFSSPATTSGGTGLRLPAFSRPQQSVWEWLVPSSFLDILGGGNLPPDLKSFGALMIASAVLGAWLLAATRQAVAFAVIICCLSLASYASLAIQPSGDMNLPLYLLQPYFAHALMQSGAVMGFLFFGVGIHLVASASTGLVFGASALAAILSVLIPVRSYAAQGERFNLTPRAKLCGTMGCVSAEEKEALAFVRRFTRDVLAKYPRVSYDDAPKILMLGYPTELGVEKWVFPSGASRLLPLESSLPVAFFYGRGSPSWTFENYRQHICNQFDFDWIRRRNIRFLFMSKKNSGCIRGRERVIDQSQVLFENDGALVLKLF